MALTPENVKTLNALFPKKDHEFNQGRVYIRERAVCDRIELVDPSWCFDVKSVQVRDNEVVVVATMTLCGCVREGVGMAKIIEKGAEAEKSAATDALKRCARLFGIGRYLLDAPDERQFNAWLAKQAGTDAPVEPPRAAPKPANGKPAEPPAPNGWTQEQAASLVTEAKNRHVTTDELLGVLGVKRISEYEPGFGAARRALADYVKARPAQPDSTMQEVAF